MAIRATIDIGAMAIIIGDLDVVHQLALGV